MTKYNHAFIDAQNLYKNTKANRWAVDLRKFRRYLWEKYIVFTVMSALLAETKEKIAYKKS